MWNIIASNRLVERKKLQQAQRRHLHALKNVKPSIDNNQPQNFRFLYTRPKQRLNNLQKQSQIDNSNNILVQKMISISTINRLKQTFVKDSLNYSYSKKVDREIELQNGALVKRLRSVSSQYGKRNFGKFVEEYNRTKLNMSKSRMHTTLIDLQMPSKNMSIHKRTFSSKDRPASAS